VGEWGTYWIEEDVDETEMWWACWLLNSVRSWVAKEVSSPTAVVEGDPWQVDAGELLEGLEFSDMLYRWKVQRGSQQKVVWVYLCLRG